MRTVKKILDANTGDSEEFALNDRVLLGKLSIVGSPSSNIKVFIIEEPAGVKLLKVRCGGWNGASLVLKAKTSHSDDSSFDETGVTYTENKVEQVELFQSK